jgi:hypothetical protein
VNLTALEQELADAQSAVEGAKPGNGEYFGDIEETGPESADHFKSDIGYADAFVRRHADSIRFCGDEKLWLIFDEKHGWQRDDIVAVGDTLFPAEGLSQTYRYAEEATEKPNE